MRNYPEQDLQKSCVELLQWKKPAGLFWTAINPSPAKSKAVAGISKAMGLIAGVPDMLFIKNNLTFFIEFKIGSGKPSGNQDLVIERLKSNHVNVFICRSVDEFIEIMTDMGVWK